MHLDFYQLRFPSNPGYNSLAQGAQLAALYAGFKRACEKSKEGVKRDKIEIINRDNNRRCSCMFVILMGGALAGREGSSGCRDQREGYLTAARRAG